MADEHDLSGMGQFLGDLLVPGVFLGNPLAFVVSFLAVNQVVLEFKGIVGLYGRSILRQVGPLAAVNVCGMVVDDRDHVAGLVGWGGRVRSPSLNPGLMQKMTQAGNLFHIEIVAARPLEEFSLCAHDEEKLIVPVRLHFADLRNQINYCAPG